MKKISLLTLCAGIIFSTIYTAAAQDVKPNENKQQEIIIRKNGDKDTKVTVEMKGDDIIINGKPLSEFSDSGVTVMQRKEITRRGNDMHGDDMFIAPHGGGNSFYFNDDNEKSPRPLLGVVTEKTGNGAKISDVSKGSAAEKAGLKSGDVITKVGGKKITEPEELVDAIRSTKPKSEIKISYLRNGKTIDTKAILGEQKESRIRTFAFNGDGDALSRLKVQMLKENAKTPGMNENFMKGFNLDMPPVPKPPLNFWLPQNKKLGVKIQDTDNDSGAVITNVEAGSAAEKAGLKKDDIITEVDGEKVNDTNEVREKIMENEKSNYTIKAKRGTAEMSFQIKTPKEINSADL